MRFRAAVLREVGSLSIEELEIPQLRRGQVLVEVIMSGLCRSQLMEVRGWRGYDRWIPHMLGHEGIGVVREIGPGVSKVAPGSEVVLTWIKGDGLDAEPIVFQSNQGSVNAGPVTTLSEFTVVSENRLFRKPAQMSDIGCVLLGCALPTGAGMAINSTAGLANPLVVVLGLGGIGMSALLTLKAMGIRNLIAADSNAKKVEWARDQGVPASFAGSLEAIRSNIFEVFPNGADVVIESAGSVETIQAAFSLLSPSGQLVFASHPPAGDLISIDPYALIEGRRIRGTWGGDFNPHRDSGTLIELLNRSNIELESMSSSPRPLHEVNTLLNLLEDGVSMRPIVSMDFAK